MEPVFYTCALESNDELEVKPSKSGLYLSFNLGEAANAFLTRTDVAELASYCEAWLEATNVDLTLACEVEPKDTLHLTTLPSDPYKLLIETGASEDFYLSRHGARSLAKALTKWAGAEEGDD